MIVSAALAGGILTLAGVLTFLYTANALPGLTLSSNTTAAQDSSTAEVKKDFQEEKTTATRTRESTPTSVPPLLLPDAPANVPAPPPAAPPATYDRPPDWPTAPTPPPVRRPQVRFQPRQLVSGFLDVTPFHYTSYQFNVPEGAQGFVEGEFSAGQHHITVVLLRQEQFAAWQNNQTFYAYFNSGHVQNGSLHHSIPPGDYYLIFDNRQAMFITSHVLANVMLRPL